MAETVLDAWGVNPPKMEKIVLDSLEELKSWPAFFQEIKAGRRTADIRNKTDRQFYVGKKMVFREYDPFKGEYTGERVVVEVTHVTSNDTPCALSSAVLDRDYCVLSLKVISK